MSLSATYTQRRASGCRESCWEIVAVGIEPCIMQPFNLVCVSFTRQEYVSELFHYLHSSADSPQLLALLESFLFSVVRDVKHYASENQRLEDALKRSVNQSRHGHYQVLL